MAEANSKAEYFVGVDLGGTKILSGVFKHSLECIGSAKASTKAQRGVEAVIERIARCVQDAVDEADLSLKQVAGIGIGAPGAVDFAEGRVIFAPNMEGWKDVPLKKDLEKLLGVPVFVENDCNISALGVHVAELKAKPKHLIGIFIGTGLGGGLIINGASIIPPGKSATWSWMSMAPNAAVATKVASRPWPAVLPSSSKSRPASKTARKPSSPKCSATT